MTNNLNVWLNELLYKNKNNELDNNSFKVIDSLFKKYEFNNNYLVNYVQSKNISISNNEQLKTTIHNILINDFLAHYNKFLNNQKHSEKLIIDYLKNSFKVPKIYLTGFECEDESNPCRITFNQHHYWTGLRCRMYIPQLYNIFSTIDINHENVDQNYWLVNVHWRQELVTNFIFAAEQFFNVKDLKWDQIPNLLYSKLIENNSDKFYFYRHLCEWIYLDNLTKEDAFEYKTLNYLKPIINLEFTSFIKSLNNPEKFDYIIINDTNTISWKYIILLMYLANKIIVLGDDTKLVDVDRVDSIKNIFKLVSNQHQELIDLFKELKLLETANNQSIYSWVISILNNK